MPRAGTRISVLRVAMILAGVLGSAAFVTGLLSEDPPVWVLLLNVPAALLGVSLLFFGLTLRSRLQRQPSEVVLLCAAAMVIHGCYALSELAWNLTHGHFPIPRSLVSFLLAWFLYAQSRRVVRERVGGDSAPF